MRSPSKGDAPAITLRDLTVSYRGHPAVHHLSGAFGAGQSTAVVGPNGAGKSSLLGALGGTIREIGGRIERDPALRVAYLPQASSLDRSFPVRVHEVVAMGLWSRIGCFGGFLFGALLLWFDVAGLATMIFASPEWPLFLLMLFFGLFVTFGSIGMGVGVMGLGEERD